jgi:beta-phosphoglucomutase-like phosphatase (HAD superfamily)
LGRTGVSGLVFDLDNTLLDREAAFFRVAEDYYDEHLLTVASVTRDEAVAMMVCWDGDGYVDREEMLMRWLGEWPDAGLDMKSLDGVVPLGDGAACGA